MCGIVGIVSTETVNQQVYDALLLLQHRGQDSTGIATVEGNQLHLFKNKGQVREAFRTRDMRSLLGNVGLGHVRYATAGAAGMDICAAESLTLRVGKRHAVATGFAFAIPEGYEVQVRPRSGLALKHGITCLNTPGTIDSDYRGEVKVILANLGEDDFPIAKGDRIAQIVVAPVTHATMVEVTELDDTERGAGGFGSTGV